jgi:hypothetical protein
MGDLTLLLYYMEYLSLTAALKISNVRRLEKVRHGNAVALMKDTS